MVYSVRAEKLVILAIRNLLKRSPFKRKTAIEKGESMSSEYEDILRTIGEYFYKELAPLFPIRNYKVCLNIRKRKPYEDEVAYVSSDLLNVITITIVTDSEDNLIAHLIHEYFHVYIADYFNFIYLVRGEWYDEKSLRCNLREYANVFRVIIRETCELAEKLTIDYYALNWLEYYVCKAPLNSDLRSDLKFLADIFYEKQVKPHIEDLKIIISKKVKMHWYKSRGGEKKPLSKRGDFSPIKFIFIYNEKRERRYSLFDLLIVFLTSIIFKEKARKYLREEYSVEKIIQSILDCLIGLDGEEKDALSRGLNFLADLIEKLRRKMEDYQRTDPKLVFKEFVEASLSKLAGIECIVNGHTIKVRDFNLEKGILKPIYRWYVKFLTKDN